MQSTRKGNSDNKGNLNVANAILKITNRNDRRCKDKSQDAIHSNKRVVPDQEGVTELSSRSTMNNKVSNKSCTTEKQKTLILSIVLAVDATRLDDSNSQTIGLLVIDAYSEGALHVIGKLLDYSNLLGIEIVSFELKESQPYNKRNLQ